MESSGIKLHNKYEVYNKVLCIIKSCKLVCQMTVAYVMIENFDKLYHDDYLTQLLDSQWFIHLNAIGK